MGPRERSMASLDIYPGSEALVRELIEKHRFKVDRVRDADGRIVDGEWRFVCRTGAIIYQYDEDTWAADLLSTRWHNRLILRFGSAMTFSGQPADLARLAGPGDEHTLHFPAELIMPVAKVLKVRRRARRTKKQRETAARLIAAYNNARKRAAGQSGGVDTEEGIGANSGVRTWPLCGALEEE
jgi:hypothetical protein